MALFATTTLATYSTTTTPTTGAFSISALMGSLVATATPITVFIDSNATFKAVTVTKTAFATTTGTIANLDLYKDHMTLKNQGGIGTTTKVTDLMRLIVVMIPTFNSRPRHHSAVSPWPVDKISLIASSTTFYMNAPVETHTLEVATTSTVLASSALTVAGDLRQNGSYKTAAGGV